MPERVSLNRSADPADLYDCDQAATYLRAAEHTLAVWRSTKRYALPYVKIGRLVRYRKADLDAFIERNVIGAESE